ncbi:MAG: competence protein ComEA [Desulforhopalus sp.]|jgi:competence protein ComEA
MISRKMLAGIAIGTTLMLSLTAGNSFSEEKSGMAALTDAAQQASTMAEKGSLTDMIDINKATPEMLSSIPGIGPKLGDAIAAYRDANGSFSQIKDLLNVEGIDMSLLEKIKPFLKF